MRIFLICLFSGALLFSAYYFWKSKTAFGHVLQGEVIVELTNWASSKKRANKETPGTRAHSKRAIEIDAARSELPYIINYSSGNSITAERDFMKRAFSGISEYDNELEERRLRNLQCIFKGGSQSERGKYLVDNVVWGPLMFRGSEHDHERFTCYTPHLLKGGKLDRKGLMSLTSLSFASITNFSGFFPIRVYTERDITKVIGPDTIYLNDEIFINGTVSCAVRSRNMGCAVAASEIRFGQPESASKPALNVKSEIIAEQEFTPNQTILLKMTENLLKWDKSAQDNFTMLWGRDLFNHYNFNMSNRKPKLETLKPCLMEDENSLIPNIVVVNCITEYWLK